MSVEDAPETRVGELLAGKYQLEQLLGAGGMGAVYRAENKLIGRTVAIKVLHAEFAKKSDIVARFMQEGRAANLVRHVNVVDVLDVGQDERGAPFIVQEFLHGNDFAKYLEAAGGRLPPEGALEILLPVIDAVALAHAKGVVHRDLKPENIFLAEHDGFVTPKLLDFGISHIANSQPGNARLTTPGVAMGTPAYMSPEQVLASHTVDARTDVWALGVILYETLSGAMPYEADNPSAYMVKVASQEPRPLSEVAPHVPLEFVHVVARCLRRDVAARYPSAAELARDLRLASAGSALGATGQRVAMRMSDPSLRSAPSSPFAIAAPPSRPQMDALPELDLDAPPPKSLSYGNGPLPELDLSPAEKEQVQFAMKHATGFGMAPPPPPSAPAVLVAPPDEASLELDLRPKKNAVAAKVVRRGHQVGHFKKKVYGAQHASVLAAIVAGVGLGMLFAGTAIDLRGGLTSGMEFYAELSYWWLRAIFAAIALIVVIVTLYFALRERPNSLGLALAGVGMLAVLGYEGVATLTLFGGEGGDRALAVPRWLLVSAALLPLGMGVHAASKAWVAFTVDERRGAAAALSVVAGLALALSLEAGTLYAAPPRALRDPAVKELVVPISGKSLGALRTKVGVVKATAAAAPRK